MTKEELLSALAHVAKNMDGDKERAHIVADALLLGYIDDEDIEKVYREVDKWYA